MSSASAPGRSRASSYNLNQIARWANPQATGADAVEVIAQPVAI